VSTISRSSVRCFDFVVRASEFSHASKRLGRPTHTFGFRFRDILFADAAVKLRVKERADVFAMIPYSSRPRDRFLEISSKRSL
jgi:hypothetical protein